jgi:hypothetical protein
MDIIEKFIRENCWRFPKGYPDINNPEDKALLFELLGVDKFLAETTLSRSELLKYDTRIEKFVDKFLREEPFEAHNMEPIHIDALVIDNKEFSLDDSKEDIQAAIKVSKRPIKIKGTSNEETIQTTTSALTKTAEFGGKGAGSGTKKEDMALADASSKLSKLNNGQPVSLIVNNEAYEGITGMVNIPKTPKSDFAYTVGDSPVIFISHKDGRTAKDFQQYGGVAQPGVVNHPEVLDFVKAVKNELQNPTQMVGRTAFTRPVENPELIRKLVYGLEFKEGGPYGEQNVQAVYQGPIEYEKTKESPDVYIVTANHVINSPGIPEGDYAPYFFATFRRNRNQFGIKDIRFGVYSKIYNQSAKQI